MTLASATSTAPLAFRSSSLPWLTPPVRALSLQPSVRDAVAAEIIENTHRRSLTARARNPHPCARFRCRFRTRIKLYATESWCCTPLLLLPAPFPRVLAAQLLHVVTDKNTALARRFPEVAPALVGTLANTTRPLLDRLRIAGALGQCWGIVTYVCVYVQLS